MTQKERVAAEVRLGFDLLRHFIAHPKDLEQVPNGAYVDVVSSEHYPLQVPKGEQVVLFEATRTFRRHRPAA